VEYVTIFNYAKRGISFWFFYVMFWGYTLWSLLDAYVISYPHESRIPLVIQSNDRLRAGLTNNAPQAIQTSPIASFASTGDRRDFLTQITNRIRLWASLSINSNLMARTRPRVRIQFFQIVNAILQKSAGKDSKAPGCRASGERLKMAPP
jgi:hypothetical protein